MMSKINKKIVALLPMKAESERIKGKNFKDFNGRPLFHWVLETLLDSDFIDQVVINTDARDMLLSYGVTPSNRLVIRDRKPEICGDEVSMNDVLADDVQHIDADIYLMTHTTNPLLSPVTIQQSIQVFDDALCSGSADSLFTVDKLQDRLYKKTGAPLNHDPTNLVRTQDLEPLFLENSNLYLFTRSSFFACNARIGHKPIMFEINKSESIDIDTPDDWELALAISIVQSQNYSEE